MGGLVPHTKHNVCLHNLVDYQIIAIEVALDESHLGVLLHQRCDPFGVPHKERPFVFGVMLVNGVKGVTADIPGNS